MKNINIIQNIYIINNEEIKEEDYRLNIQRGYFKKADKEGLKYYNKQNSVFKKIILTTDQDLIKDGIQSIDDEFLEWFVKNPSCEEIEVESNYRVKSGTIQEHKEGKAGYEYYDYKIIIPKEEPKQETLEEAAEHYQLNDNKIHHNIQYRAFRAGAKWQAERSQQIVPFDAYNIEVFAIKPDEQSKLFAYIGYNITNGNFHFNVVPFTEPKQEKEKYSEEDLKLAYFSAIESTGEGWNGEYAKGNNPDIEETFGEGFIEWFEQFKKK